MAYRNLALHDASIAASGPCVSGFSVTNSLSILGATSSMLDLGQGPNDEFDPQRTEFALLLPALSGTQLPANTSINYGIYSSPNADGSTPTVEIATLASQAGSSAAATTVRFKLRQAVNRYLFFGASSATTSSSAATASVTLTAYF